MVRLIDPETGRSIKEFAPVAGQAGLGRPERRRSRPSPPKQEETRRDRGPARRARSWSALEVQPAAIQLTSRFAYAQLLVTGTLDSGETIDVTRMVEPTLSAAIAEVSRSGLVRPRADGKATLRSALGGQVRRGAGDRLGRERRRRRSTSSTTSPRSSRGSAATRGPATARPRARTASSSRSAATTRSSTSAP